MARLTQILTALMLVLLPRPAAAQGDWTYRNPLPTAEPIFGIGYGNGLFVAVGWGDILTSPDGTAWTVRRKPDPGVSLQSVAFGSGVFVTVGYNHIAGSADGAVWSVFAPVRATLRDVIHAGGIFVAVGDTTVLTSPDGRTWTRRSDAPGTWKAVAYGNGRFVAVGSAKSSLTSADGITWTAHAADTSRYFNGVAFGNGRFVAVDSYGPRVSDDGTTWAKPSGAVGGYFEAIAYGNGRFVGALDGGAAWSADGLTWKRASQAREWNLGIAYGGGQFIMVGRNGTLFGTLDGEIWDARHKGRRDNFKGVAFGHDRFVAISDSVILSSEEGINWTRRFSQPYAGLRGIARHAGRFAAVGAKGVILASEDGLAWNSVSSPIDSDLTALTATPTGFLAGGKGGITLSSPDGLTWSRSGTVPCLEIRELGYFGNFLVAHGLIFNSEGGLTILSWLSRDGRTWERILEGKAFGNFASGAGRLVIGGSDDTLYATEDGAAWKLVKVAKPVWLGPPRLYFANGRFLANWIGGWFHSADGLTWGNGTGLISSNHIAAIAFGKGIYLGVGDYGTIVTAPDLPPGSSARSPGSSRSAPPAIARLRTVPGGWEIHIRMGEPERLIEVSLYDAVGHVRERHLVSPTAAGAVIRGVGGGINLVAAGIEGARGGVIVPLVRD